MARPLRFVLLLIVLCGLLAALVWLSLDLAGSLGLSGSTILVPTLLTVVVLSAAGIYIRFGAARGLATESQEGVALLNQGRPAEALAVFDRCEQKAARLRLGGYVELFQMNRAAALIRTGDAATASRLCRALLEKNAGERNLLNYAGNLVAITATAMLLENEADLDAVQRLLDEHEPATAAGQRALLIPPRALLLARRGDDGAVIALLDGRWQEAEGMLPARILRSLHLLWAFALHRRGDFAGARGRLERAGTDIADEAAHLVRDWPELASFAAGGDSYRQPSA